MFSLLIFSLILIRPIILFSLVTDQYLTHYWSFSDETMVDSIGTAHMQQGMNSSFTSDRFGCPNSALNLNGGYTYVPAGVYFDSPEFTISVWIYPMQIGKWARVTDFGNGDAIDNIVLAIDSGNNRKPDLSIYSDSSVVTNTISNQEIINEQWQLLTVTFDGSNLAVYINGTPTKIQSITYSLPKINRTKNYIGKSNFILSDDGYSYSYLDDLRFYTKSLTQTEIMSLLNESNLSKSYFV